MQTPKKYWLMKSESCDYSIDDFAKDKCSDWHGVRNYQARNFMRDEMNTGDLVLFYHSNSAPSGVAGLGEVIRRGYPDFTQFDSKSEYFDPKASKEKPIWYMVDIQFKGKFPHFISLEELKKNKVLQGMLVAHNGRLSVQPVEEKHFYIVTRMGQKSVVSHE